MNRRPAALGHVLVIPKRHAADIWDLEEEDCADDGGRPSDDLKTRKSGIERSQEAP
jgi:hypothetical protein